jgi:hypothetical protein
VSTNEKTPRDPAPPKPARFRPWVATGGLHRAGANLVTVGIGGIAGYISWLHLYALGTSQPLTPGLSARQEHTVAALTPFSIDGLILAGTLKLREARLENRPAHWAAYLAVLLGVGLTLAGNIASAPDALWARVLAAAPPAAFLISVEILAGKPLTRNLWDMIRSAWAGKRANNRPGVPARTAVPVPTTAEPGSAPGAPEPDRTPDTATPVTNPQPENVPPPLPEPTPQEPAERAAERLTPPARPSAPTRTRTPATRGAGRSAGAAPAVGQSTRRRTAEPEKIVGTKTRPMRLVGGEVLDYKELAANARQRIEDRLRQGAPREGLGAWVARQYDPEMSLRWGQERLAEVPNPEPAEPLTPELPAEAEPADPEGLADATALVPIYPAVPVEDAVPIEREPEPIPA